MILLKNKQKKKTIVVPPYHALFLEQAQLYRKCCDRALKDTSLRGTGPSSRWCNHGWPRRIVKITYSVYSRPFRDTTPLHSRGSAQKVFKISRVSRCTVAPPPATFLSRNRRLWNQLPAVSPEIRCPLTPRRHRSMALCTQENGLRRFFISVLPRVEQPWNVRWRKKKKR